MLENATDKTLLARFDSIGKPRQVKIVLELDGVDAGFKIIEGRWIRCLKWDIIVRVLTLIEREYNIDRDEPLVVSQIDYRLERVENNVYDDSMCGVG